ncbi:MAG: cellulase family glycosylhydrolase [Prevotella sp.]|nr:cellulase family glycosylhydrolase [Prevotella sp.]
MKQKKLLLSLAFALMSMAGLAADNLPALRVQGKNLVDANGKTVVLHGVMDTPNRYFNGNRWGMGGYEVGDETPCLNYFEKMFTAITDKNQGAYCTVFRLHMDPCWTNYNAPVGTQENNIQYFSENRYKTFLSRLYVKLVQKALAHGLYVIVRPPGVCPQNIKVGDEYQTYLKNVWKIFASNSIIQKYAGQVSIELANEPVHVQLADGTNSDKALHDFFQPIVDVIRRTGFEGIIWVPGAGYQSQYQNYVKYPITDRENNFSYSVHVYSGWYGNMTDANCDHNTFIRNFQNQVPMVTSKPIMVTEIDWSPNDPDRASEGHYNEWNQWVAPNFGTWATGSTSKWGLAWKAVHDHFGNIGMTITHPQEYYDIDEYLNSGKVRPGLQNAKKHNLFEECCSYACFNWYKDWYLKQTTGVEETIANTADVKYTLYYNIEGQQVAKPQKGMYIIKQVLKDGKVRVRKVCNAN